MRGGFRLASLVVAASMAPADVLAVQSMAEAAQRERERRARIAKKPAPVYTEADLAARRGDRPGAPAASPSPAASASPGAPLEDEHSIRERQEAEWRGRFEAARERVRQAEAAAWRTVVETVFVSGIPVQQWVRKREDTPEVRAANKALADLEEEFRRTGLPPGWGR